MTSCAKNTTKFEETTSEFDLVNKIRKEVFVKLLVEELLHPCGTSAQMMDEIKMLGFSFDYYHEIDVEGARKLVLKASEVALNKINNCEKIRPYLVQYPFKTENIEVSIFIRDPNVIKLLPEKLQIITMKEGIIYYKNLTRDANRFLTIMHQETYEEALINLDTTIGSNL